MWIKSCITAKNLTEKKNYLIVQDKDANDVIVPIDYHNTGIVQAKTSWSNGLHQFLQIKHGLKITAESFVTSFISNLGFIKSYGTKIYGMSGTLGSVDAQNLLTYIYDTDLVFIPTYKIKRFQELPSILSNSQEEWLSNVTQTTIEHTSNGRAVLIICETIQNVELVNNALLLHGYPSNHVKLYSRNDTNENLVIAENIDSKDVIIATNLAGRGTDIKTTRDVEKNGGLHVCLSFLPSNLRVELQAFGRTSRQGNEGTAQLVINEQEANSLLKIDLGTITTIEEYKKLRDEREHNNLQRVQLYDAEKIILEDQLFSLFCKLTHELKAKENSKSKLSQLEENWGITFKNIKQFITDTLNSLPEEEKANPSSIKNIILETKQQALLKFNEFRARMLLEYSSGYEIMRNPAYLVTESFNNMATGGYARSAELFDLAANLDDNFSSSAHYNAAYAIIRGKIGNYKQAALEHLELAADGIKQVLIPNLEVLQVTSTKSSDSPLTKQIIQKIELLKLQLNYIDKTKATIEGCAGKNYIEISENRLLREFFTFDKTPEAEISELNIFGIHTFYDVKEVEPPTDVFGAVFMAVAAVVQIGIGIACTMSGNVALGASLLIEGFQDALAAMKIANNDDFDWKNYFSAKGISAAVTVVTIGATSLMNKLATAKTAAELGIETAKQALLEAGKEITEKAIKQELMKAALKEIAKRVVINTAIDKIASKAMNHVLNEFKDEIRQHVERNINRCIDLSVTHNQLMHLFELDDFNGNMHNYQNITQSALNVLKHNQSVLNNIASRVINEVASNHTMPSVVKGIATTAKAVDMGRALIDIGNVVDRLQDRLSSHIASLDQSSPDIAGILEKKLHPVFNSTKAKETVAILEKQGFIVNGRFVKIDGIDEIDSEKYDHLKKHIVRPCKKLYEAQHKEYNHLTQKLKSDLINYVVRSMLGSIRSEIMHPVLATPLAKISNMVTEGIAKTFAEFTDGQRLKAIEAKIAANASKQDEASRGFYGPAVGAGDDESSTSLKKQEKSSPLSNLTAEEKAQLVALSRGEFDPDSIEYMRENPKTAALGMAVGIGGPLAVAFGPSIAAATGVNLVETATVLGAGVRGGIFSSAATSTARTGAMLFTESAATSTTATLSNPWLVHSGFAATGTALYGIGHSTAPHVSNWLNSFNFSSTATHNEPKLPIFDIHNSGVPLIGGKDNFGSFGNSSLFDSELFNNDNILEKNKHGNKSNKPTGPTFKTSTTASPMPDPDDFDHDENKKDKNKEAVKERKINCTKQESPVWKELESYKGNIKTNGLSSKEQKFYQWDHLHNDIEVFDKNFKHIGSMDPIDGKMYKGPKGHNIRFK